MIMNYREPQKVILPIHAMVPNIALLFDNNLILLFNGIC